MTPIGPGTLLAGRFRLVDLLEEAGGARFWRAEDMVLRRDVTVHVVDENDPRAEALLAAARQSATVPGPHLLRVLDAADEDGVVYLVNEWSNGASLDRLLLEGPLPPRQAAWLVREVATAIEEAHRHGVAHGRLLPQNVIVTDTGSVKLVGFVVDEVLHGRGDPTRSARESDVLDLGALLYAALVGRWPGTPGATLEPAPRAHGRVLRPRQVRAGIPSSLDRLCGSVLDPDTEHVVPLRSAQEIRAALADFLGEADEVVPEGPVLPGLGRRAAARKNGALGLPQHGDPEATQAGIPPFADAHETHETRRAEPGADPGTDQTTVTPVRPLYAPGPPRPPAAASPGRTPYVGMGSGTIPAVWGPDAESPETPDPGYRGEPPGSSWLRLAGLVGGVALLVVAVVIAFNLGRGGTTPPEPQDVADTPAAQPEPVEPAAVSDFDPFQDGGPQEENREQVPRAHDGDPSTAWMTKTYLDGPDITVYKPGVGLLLDLGQERPVADVGLTLVGSPSTVELLAAPEGSAAPTGTDGLQRVAVADDAGTEVTLTPQDDVITRYLVVWFTGLPPVEGGYRGGVAEVVVRS